MLKIISHVKKVHFSIMLRWFFTSLMLEFIDKIENKNAFQ